MKKPPEPPEALPASTTDDGGRVPACAPAEAGCVAVRHGLVFEEAPIGLFALDTALRVTAANRALRALLAAPDPPGPAPPERLEAHVRDTEALATWATALRERGEATSRPLRVGRGDGVWVRLDARRLEPGEPGPCAYVGSVTDMSPEVRSEERLRAGEERLARILETTLDGVVIASPRGRLTYANAAARELLGLAPGAGEAEIVLPSPDTWRLMGPDGVTPLPADDPVRLAVSQRLPVRDVLARVRRPGGDEVVLAINSAPLTGATGEVEGVVAALRDETRRLALEAELRQAQKLEAVARLASGAAHDFNNVLSVILTSCDYVGEVPREQRAAAIDEVMADIRGAAAHGAQLAHRLLHLGRRQPATRAPVDVHRLLDTVLGVVERMLGADIDCRVVKGARSPVILADAVQVEQIVLNLAVNARDAMPRGGTLEIETADGVGPEGRPELHLHVRDTGVGMTPEVQARVFEPFFTTKGEGRGSGLGMPTVLGIAKEHGGRVALDSAPGAGTRVTVSLPAAPAERHDDAPSRPRMGAGGGWGERILLVEDEPTVRRTLRRILESAGYRVLEAEGAPDALFLVEEQGQAVDVVLTDVVMPRMNGLDLLRRLRSRRPDLPAVLMSGYMTVHLHEGAAGLPGPVPPVLTKPFGQHALLAHVAGALGR